MSVILVNDGGSERAITYLELVPEAWRNCVDPQIRVVTYQGLRTGGADLPNGLDSLDLEGTRIQFVRGAVTVTRPDVMRPTFEERDGSIFMVTSHPPPEAHLSARGTYVLFLLPPHEPEGREQTWGEDLAAAVGLAQMLWGPNLLHGPISDFNVNLTAGQLTVTSASARNPLFLPEVSLAPSRIGEARDTVGRIAELSPADRQRVRLALRWLAASCEAAAQDAFLRAWVGIEALAFEGDTDIAALREPLGLAYGIPRKDVLARFLIGRLASLRAAILHGGLLTQLDEAIVEHTRAVLVDVLHSILGLPSERRADATVEAARAPLLKLTARKRKGSL